MWIKKIYKYITGIGIIIIGSIVYILTLLYRRKTTKIEQNEIKTSNPKKDIDQNTANNINSAINNLLH